MDYTVTRANLATFAQLIAERLVRRVFAGKARRKITHEQFVIVTANAVVECFDDIERARERIGATNPTATPATAPCGKCGHAKHGDRTCMHRDDSGAWDCVCGGIGPDGAPLPLRNARADDEGAEVEWRCPRCGRDLARPGPCAACDDS